MTRSPDRRWLGAAALVAAANIGLSPYFGLIRDLLLDTFSRRALVILAALLAGAGALLLIRTLRQLRGPRWKARAGALLTALALAVFQTFAFSRGNFQVDLVEKFHFVQYGLLAYLVYRAFLPLGDRSSWLLPALAAWCCGALEEGAQWLSPLRVGEYADVGLNLFAALLGTLVAWALRPSRRDAAQWSPAGRRWAYGTALVALVVNLLFVHHVHLGQRLEFQEAGLGGPVSFLSWHSEAELKTKVEERRERWSQTPFEAKKGFPEDYFASEAGWRVSHRNASLERGDLHVAWVENRLLETFFEPFLDQRSPRDGQTHRWSPEQRQRIDRERPRTPQPPYISPVLASRIWTLPQPRILWTATLPLVLTLFAGWILELLRPSIRRKANSPRPEATP
ncbi:MAG: hypothetical protein AAGD01_01755 [Acidobacteriota bacterium]